MFKRLLALSVIAGLVATIGFGGAAAAAPPPGTFFQGFEQNTNGWISGADRNIVRVRSGYVSGTGYASGSLGGRQISRASRHARVRHEL